MDKSSQPSEGKRYMIEQRDKIDERLVEQNNGDKATG